MSANLTRKNQSPRPAQHRAICSVCKHADCEEIEKRYLDFEPQVKLATDYSLQESAISRHISYFDLEAQRSGDTERLLKVIISRGFKQNQKVGDKLFIEAVKEFNKITGKHKEPQKNPIDSAKDYLHLMKERMPELTDLDLFELSIKSKSQWKDLTAEMLGIEEVRENEEDRTRR